jgi:hypothetical protein
LLYVGNDVRQTKEHSNSPTAPQVVKPRLSPESRGFQSQFTLLRGPTHEMPIGGFASQSRNFSRISRLRQAGSAIQTARGWDITESAFH